MSAFLVSVGVFLCLFGAAMLGMQLRFFVPGEHLSEESRKALEICLGIIGTMAGLVLGLLVSSATSAYNAQRNEVLDVSSKVILLDRELAEYGPEANGARRLLKENAQTALYLVWPKTAAGSQLAPTSGAEFNFAKMLRLRPKNADQQMLKGEIVGLVTNLLQTHWLMHEQVGTGVSPPLLVMLVFWFTMTLFGLGVLAPRSATTIVALALSSLAIAGAIFLVLELYSPFSGIVQISSAPLRDAIARLGQ